MYYLNDYTATLLPNGKVLVAGGESGNILALAMLYDPATGTWTATGSMMKARSVHTATLLPNGKVLVAGGFNPGYEMLASAELYDPATGMWTRINPMGTPRVYHAATLLPDGKVLVSGGVTFGAPGSSEIYDPGSGTWTATGSMGTARRYHPSLLSLAGGKVLVAGGRNEANRTIASAELYTSTQVLRPKSNSVQDGWVLETSETSNQGGLLNAAAATLILGDSANRQQYRSILSFNTRPLPDTAVVTRVVLKIKKQGVSGADPFTTHGPILVDIRQGPFSQNGALQSTDFQTAATLAAATSIAGRPQAGGWYIAQFNADARAFINRTGATQFRLRFQRDDDNDAVADFLRFYSGDAAPANRPVLVVEYYVP
jgi:hypothetical protein